MCYYNKQLVKTTSALLDDENERCLQLEEGLKSKMAVFWIAVDIHHTIILLIEVVGIDMSIRTLALKRSGRPWKAENPKEALGLSL